MKKLLSIILCIMMLSGSISALAKTDFLTEVYNNYTGKYTVKMSFQSGEEVLKLLKSVNMPAEVENFIDIKSLLESLLTFDSKMLLQLDSSEDFKKISMALTSESAHNVDVNKNLKVNVDAKMGMWVDIDISDIQKPIMKVIYSYPYTNKYMVIDAFEMMSDEEKAQVAGILSTVLSKNFITAINTYSSQLIEKYADIITYAGKIIIKIDNEALCGMIGEIVPYVMGQINTLLSVMGEDGFGLNGALDEFSFKPLKILGDKGLTYTYTFKGGKILNAKQEADISIDVAQIYEALTEEKWNYTKSSEIKFNLLSDVSLSNIGTTSPAFPVLTSENSFSVKDMLPQQEYSIAKEEERTYPLWWAGGSTEKLPVIEGKIYVPLRQTLENAYEDKVLLSYENGVVKAESEYFPSFKVMTLILSENKIYTDNNAEKSFGIILENGITYVEKAAFEELLGWQFSSATHDMITNEYYYDFYTRE